MTIGNICKFKLSFDDADFWLIRKGSESMVGKPVKEYSNEYIGVKIIDDKVDPNFMCYYFQYMYQKGLFAAFSNGTLSLKSISISDIKDIPVVFNNNE